METDRVFSGQMITVRLLEPPDKLLEPDSLSVKIEYADFWIAVVNKPPDLVTHPTGDFQKGTLANAVQHWLDQRTGIRGLLRRAWSIVLIGKPRAQWWWQCITCRIAASARLSKRGASPKRIWRY